MPKNNLVLIIHQVRSCHNVGSLIRTAEGLGVTQVYMSGITPYPRIDNDKRLPHVEQRATNQIHKTALGAEELIKWQHFDKINDLLEVLKGENYKVVALEQASSAQPLASISPRGKVALIVGNEVEGLEKSLLDKADITISIPMRGKKESFNVAIAAAIAMYHLAHKMQTKVDKKLM